MPASLSPRPPAGRLVRRWRARALEELAETLRHHRCARTVDAGGRIGQGFGPAPGGYCDEITPDQTPGTGTTTISLPPALADQLTEREQEVVLLMLRANFLVIVLAAGATAALLRALGWG